jgi:dihydrodipicolinate reductase
MEVTYRVLIARHGLTTDQDAALHERFDGKRWYTKVDVPGMESQERVRIDFSGPIMSTEHIEYRIRSHYNEVVTTTALRLLLHPQTCSIEKIIGEGVIGGPVYS